MCVRVRGYVCVCVHVPSNAYMAIAIVHVLKCIAIAASMTQGCVAALYYLNHLRSCCANATGKQQTGNKVTDSDENPADGEHWRFCKTAMPMPDVPAKKQSPVGKLATTSPGPCWRTGLSMLWQLLGSGVKTAVSIFMDFLSPCCKTVGWFLLEFSLLMPGTFQHILSLTPLEVCALTSLTDGLATIGGNVFPNMMWQNLLAVMVLLLATAGWHVPQQLPCHSLMCRTLSCMCCYVLRSTHPMLVPVAFFVPTFGKQGRLPFAPSSTVKSASPASKSASKAASSTKPAPRGDQWIYKACHTCNFIPEWCCKAGFVHTEWCSRSTTMCADNTPGNDSRKNMRSLLTPRQNS